MDLSLLVTVGIIFLATFIASALRASRKDLCLRDFDGFHITVEPKEGQVLWGIMRLESSGFELEYRQDVMDAQMHMETSHVLYKGEYPSFQAIYRYVDDLSPENRAKRDRSYERAFNPSPFQRLLRAIRNFTNTASDSLTEAFNLVLGRAKPVADKTLLGAGQTHLTGLTKDILGYVGTSYDPMLEDFVGARMVLEVNIDGQGYEYVGVLKDYSADFLELLDVYFVQPLGLILESAPDSKDKGIFSEPTVIEARHEGIQATIEEGVLFVRNDTLHPILLIAIDADDKSISRKAIIDSHDLLRYPLSNTPRCVELSFWVIHQVDMIVARDHALIRHRTVRPQGPDLLGIPITVDLSLRDRQKKRRRRSRQSWVAGAAEARSSIEKHLLERELIPEEDKRLSKVLVIRQQTPGDDQSSPPQGQEAQRNKTSDSPS